MATRLAALFPGQGAFDGKVLQDIGERYPRTREVFDVIDEVTIAAGAGPLAPLLFDGEPTDISALLANDPWVSQLAIFGTDVATFDILRSCGITPDVLAGHSLGEIPALVCAGAYSVADGARIVWERVRAMDGVDIEDGYLAALSAGAVRVTQLLALIGDGHLVVAVENHAEQTVVSGPAAAMDILRQLSAPLGISFTRLSSPLPFHGPLLAPAVDRFASAIRHLSWHAPDIPVYSPILRRRYAPDDDLADCLAAHLITPVHFGAGLRQLCDEGVDTFVECGALASLTKIVVRVLGPDQPLAVAALVADNGQPPIDVAVTALRAARVPQPRVESTDLSRTGRTGEIDSFWEAHGSAIIALVRQEFERYVDGVHGPVVEKVTNPGIGAAPVGREVLAGELRSLYGQALEYPEEVFTDDVLLEGELGIDSVKQGELFTRVVSRYGLTASPEDLRFAGLDTMGKVVDFVHGRLAPDATPAGGITR